MLSIVAGKELRPVLLGVGPEIGGSIIVIIPDANGTYVRQVDRKCGQPTHRTVATPGTLTDTMPASPGQLPAGLRALCAMLASAANPGSNRVSGECHSTSVAGGFVNPKGAQREALSPIHVSGEDPAA